MSLARLHRRALAEQPREGETNRSDCTWAPSCSTELSLPTAALQRLASTADPLLGNFNCRESSRPPNSPLGDTGASAAVHGDAHRSVSIDPANYSSKPKHNEGTLPISWPVKHCPQPCMLLSSCGSTTGPTTALQGHLCCSPVHL